MVDQLQFQELETIDSPSVDQAGERRMLPRVTIMVVTALAIGFVVGLLAGRPSESSETPSDSMVETIDAWVVAVEGQDAGDLAALYAADAVWHDEAFDSTFTGRERVRFAYDTVFGGDLTVTVEEIAAVGDTAVVQWTFVDSPDLDLTGISVLEFDGDVIVAETLYYDCAQSPRSASCLNM